VAVAEIVVDLHVAQRGEAVEPGVGDRLDGLRKAVLLHPPDQAFALFVHLRRPCLTGDDGDVALPLAGRDVERAALPGQPEEMGARLDSGDEVPPRLRCVGLESGFVHGLFLLDAGALAGLDGGEQLGPEFAHVAFDLGCGFQIDRR
jgi:hypothetical protein